ncbi:MAG TPA: bifunctional DNA-formamidopyrimidine glycosylase/DNA-(apurinic or apyrimidinic site) lyase [Anaerolineales bacterium]|nr:bifunctional DNA-formamidopyrimidine glycosylase/DNA-(apurinic or apyrimidinic site) lyase [Anaerolineales bacterium]
MPELPEVETIARKLQPDLVGKQILSADLLWARTLAFPTPRKFKAQIQGQKIQAVGRRAKYLIVHLTDYNLLIHLRMSGDLSIRSSTIRPEPHDRLIIKLSGGTSLVFNDTRKFGRVWLTARPEDVLGKLGPEPLGDEFTVPWLHAALHRKHRQLKPLLLDQSFLAGLGNIYTDEALHIARLHPLTLSDTLTEEQARALHEAIHNVLDEGIRRNGASFDWVYRGGEFQNYFRVYDRKDRECPVCGTKIVRILVGQRSTHFCPVCQVR